MAPIPEVKRTSLVKPTIQTHFHIDFDWWGEKDRDWRVYLQSLLCPEHQAAFAEMPDGFSTAKWSVRPPSSCRMAHT